MAIELTTPQIWVPEKMCGPGWSLAKEDLLHLHGGVEEWDYKAPGDQDEQQRLPEETSGVNAQEAVAEVIEKRGPLLATSMQLKYTFVCTLLKFFA